MARGYFTPSYFLFFFYDFSSSLHHETLKQYIEQLTFSYGVNIMNNKGACLVKP